MAIAVGCHGFFVDPVLTSMSVSTLKSTNLVNIGDTVQLQASGTYDDGSHKNLTGSATWSVTTNPTFVSVSSQGLVTALKVTPSGTVATVQAAANSSNGSVVSGTVNITLGQSATLTITDDLGTTISLATHPANSTVTFTATLNGNTVTTSTTFASSNSAIINITNAASGAGTLGGTTGTVTITGTDSVDSASGTLQITVTN